MVAGIVKLDDLGLHLTRRSDDTSSASFQRKIGRGILIAAPWLMRGLSVLGTAAMFLVGGGILTTASARSITGSNSSRTARRPVGPRAGRDQRRRGRHRRSLGAGRGQRGPADAGPEANHT